MANAQARTERAQHLGEGSLLGVDPDRLCVIRTTERIVIPERGGELGNFGCSAITPDESWVTVSEGVWSDDARRRGAEGALFVARILWSRPNRQVIPPP